MKLTEAKLKQMILDEMKSNLPLADQEKLFKDINRIKQLYAEITRLKASMRDAYDRAYDSFDYDDPLLHLNLMRFDLRLPRRKRSLEVS